MEKGRVDLSNEKVSRGDVKRLPLLPLRGLVIFPGSVITIDAGRDRSIAAVESADSLDNRLFLVAQRDAKVERPYLEDLYSVGTVCTIKQVLRLPDGALRLLVEGGSRALLYNVVEMPDLQMAEIIPARDDDSAGEVELKALMRVARQMALSLVKSTGGVRVSSELKEAISGERTPGPLADLVASTLLEDVGDRQVLLECMDVKLRLNTLIDILRQEVDISALESRIQQRVHESMDRTNHEYYLREQIKVIQEELGEAEEEEMDALDKRVDESAMADDVKEKLHKEVKKIRRMGMHAPESSVLTNYVEYMLELPWGTYTKDELRIERARKVLESEHYGLDDVKKRILEYLAVRELSGDMKGPIVCLVGPPGVGKTSIARSVANALGRKFVSMSLGGLHDEAEIRGHRRTYVGAMPGRIVAAMKQAGSMNPVFLFDEIDKMASDFRGDPASAMLEVLDPAQNRAFMDHYIEVPFDLSKVLFITTANSAETIPAPLLDRMEVIEVSSYTAQDKLQIAKKHLWPRLLKEHGLTKSDVRITDRAISEIIENYTREAGVRTLEKQLSAVLRKAAVRYLEMPEDAKEKIQIRPEDLHEYLGAQRYLRMAVSRQPEVGLVNGLAWTSVGGETLPIEVAVLPGSGQIEFTGQLGDVMKESAHIAFTVVRQQFEKRGIPSDYHKKHDIHVHLPEGAVPKDGPSAGAALASAMLSAVTGIPARQDVAMTGEITLRGKVLPIGGVREKLLAAYRAGIRTILLPKENESDLEKIPEDIRAQLDIHLVSDVEQVFDVILTGVQNLEKAVS